MSTTLQKGFGAPAEQADFFRLHVARKLDAGRRMELGQFLTPPPVARFMASMFERTGTLRLLDTGASVGMLTAAFVTEVCGWTTPPKELSVTAYEIDQKLADYLEDTLEACRVECERFGISFKARGLSRRITRRSAHSGGWCCGGGNLSERRARRAAASSIEY